MNITPDNSKREEYLLDGISRQLGDITRLLSNINEYIKKIDQDREKKIEEELRDYTFRMAKDELEAEFRKLSDELRKLYDNGEISDDDYLKNSSNIGNKAAVNKFKQLLDEFPVLYLDEGALKIIAKFHDNYPSNCRNCFIELSVYLAFNHHLKHKVVDMDEVRKVKEKF